jgi:hypothetical protein
MATAKDRKLIKNKKEFIFMSMVDLVVTKNLDSETINETHARCAGVSSTIRESDNDLFALELVITDDDLDGAVFKVIYGDDLPQLLLKQHQLALIFST